MKGQEQLIHNYGIIILVMIIAIMLIILIFNYAASHNIATPGIPNLFD